MTSRGLTYNETFYHLVSSEATEYQPFVCMEEGSHLGELEICSGHGNAQEE